MVLRPHGAPRACQCHGRGQGPGLLLMFILGRGTWVCSKAGNAPRPPPGAANPKRVGFSTRFIPPALIEYSLCASCTERPWVRQQPPPAKRSPSNCDEAGVGGSEGNRAVSEGAGPRQGAAAPSFNYQVTETRQNLPGRVRGQTIPFPNLFSIC